MRTRGDGSKLPSPSTIEKKKKKKVMVASPSSSSCYSKIEKTKKRCHRLLCYIKTRIDCDDSLLPSPSTIEKKRKRS